jgi:hypothetical protein
MDCEAGEVPNAQRDACDPCGASEISNNGVCVACEYGKIPNVYKDACVDGYSTDEPTDEADVPTTETDEPVEPVDIIQGQSGSFQPNFILSVFRGVLLLI